MGLFLFKVWVWRLEFELQDFKNYDLRVEGVRFRVVIMF